MSSGPPCQAEPARAVRASPDARTGLYGQLLAQASGLANDDLFARMLASQAQGLGALPPGLGLAQNCGGADVSVQWMAVIVTAACMGGDHLWQDLGLWSRADLSRLMTENFPALAARNSRDMEEVPVQAALRPRRGRCLPRAVVRGLRGLRQVLRAGRLAQESAAETVSAGL